MADYPQLAKFRALKRARFHSRDGTGADDERLHALSRIGFTNLFDITLLHFPGFRSNFVLYGMLV